jgi:hypothetical protein
MHRLSEQEVIAKEIYSKSFSDSKRRELERQNCSNLHRSKGHYSSSLRWVRISRISWNIRPRSQVQRYAKISGGVKALFFLLSVKLVVWKFEVRGSRFVNLAVPICSLRNRQVCYCTTNERATFLHSELEMSPRKPRRMLPDFWTFQTLSPPISHLNLRHRILVEAGKKSIYQTRATCPLNKSYVSVIPVRNFIVNVTEYCVQTSSRSLWARGNVRTQCINIAFPAPSGFYFSIRSPCCLSHCTFTLTLTRETLEFWFTCRKWSSYIPTLPQLSSPRPKPWRG